MKRCDQTPTAAGAAGGATLAPDALPLPPGALSARRATTADHRCPVEVAMDPGSLILIGGGITKHNYWSHHT